MGSMVFTEEEMRYFRALLSWEPSMADDLTYKYSKPRLPEAPLAGEFRFLVLETKRDGGTSLLNKFFESSSPPERRIPGLGNTRGCQTRIQVDEKTYKVDILEIESAQLVDTQHIENALAFTEAAAIVYDIRCRDSFLFAGELRVRIQEALAEETRRRYPLILVGNKSGDAGIDPAQEPRRQVPWAEGYKLARAFCRERGISRDGCGDDGERAGVNLPRGAFIETSSRDVNEVFVGLGRQVLHMRRLVQQQQRRLGLERQSQVDGEFARRRAESGQSSISSPKRTGKWRVWSRPWFRRSSDRGSRSNSAVA